MTSSPVGPDPAIVAAKLTKRFGDLTAVDDWTWSSPRAASTACSDPTASGKTTLIRLLTGLAKPTSGEARVLGVRMPDRENLAHIGYMTQADGIYAELSVWENVVSSAPCRVSVGQGRRWTRRSTSWSLRAAQCTRRSSCRAACGVGCRWPARSSTSRR